MAGEIHESKVGTYHPNPKAELVFDAVWTIHDSRGYIDGGPACDECGKCECEECPEGCAKGWPACSCDEHNPDGECIGLSFAFVCLDGGETLCEECAAKEGITIVPCDCE